MPWQLTGRKTIKIHCKKKVSLWICMNKNIRNTWHAPCPKLSQCRRTHATCNGTSAPSSRSVQTNPNVKIIKIPTKIQDPDQCTTTQRHVDRRANQAKQEAPQLASLMQPQQLPPLSSSSSLKWLYPWQIAGVVESENVSSVNVSPQARWMLPIMKRPCFPQIFSYSVHHIESSNICIEY